MARHSKARVIITVDGGVIQTVSFRGCPRGLTVEVRDYDTEGALPDTTDKDELGQPYYSGEWVAR